jgi:hypothetical protein
MYRIAALHISTLMQLLLDGTWFECLEETKFVAKRTDWKRNWINEWMYNAKCRNRYIKPKPKQYLYYFTIQLFFLACRRHLPNILCCNRRVIIWPINCLSQIQFITVALNTQFGYKQLHSFRTPALPLLSLLPVDRPCQLICCCKLSWFRVHTNNTFNYKH